MINSIALDPDPALNDLPKHERLRAYLLRELSDGRLKPGDALPTEFELAASASISRNTVRQALSALERLGLIFRVRGRGTFVHEAAMQRMKTEPGRSDSLNVFALVIPDSRGGYYPSLQRGFGDASAEFHHQMLVCDTDNDLFRQADSFLQLLDKKVAGLSGHRSESSKTGACCWHLQLPPSSSGSSHRLFEEADGSCT